MKKFFTQSIIALALIGFSSTVNAEDINVNPIVGEYIGDLSIDLRALEGEEEESEDPNENLIINIEGASVSLLSDGNGKISLHLKDFSIPPILAPSDIDIYNISVTQQSADTYTFISGAVRLTLSGGIIADVTASGTIINDKLNAVIDVEWLPAGDRSIILPIPVTFLGTKEPGSSIVDNKENTAKIYSIENEVIVSDYNGIVNVFNLSGINVYNKTVNGSARFALEEGLYIIKANDKVEKIHIK